MTNEIEVLNGDILKTGDERPHLRLQLLEDGYPFNLQEFGVSNGDVTLKMRRTDSDTNKVEVSMDHTNGDRGVVSYAWTSSDTDEPGTYLIQVVANDGTRTVSWPSNGYGRVYITDNL